MLAKKDAAPSPRTRTQNYEQELEFLYARRSAIDMLIRSLQYYDRYRVPLTAGDKRKLA